MNLAEAMSRKNHIEQVAKLLGLEMGERFAIDADIPHIMFAYYFDKDGIYYGDEIEVMRKDELILPLLTGKIKIIKKPWHPEPGDTYYYVNFDYVNFVDSIEKVVYQGNAIDVMVEAFGNCFRSEEEASSHKVEVVTRLNDVLRKRKNANI